MVQNSRDFIFSGREESKRFKSLSAAVAYLDTSCNGNRMDESNRNHIRANGFKLGEFEVCAVRISQVTNAVDARKALETA